VSAGTVRLTAGDAALVVAPAQGGRWTSLHVGGHELLGGAALDGVPPASLSGCFAMAPYAGRVRDGRFGFRGRTHTLPRTAPPNAIHGTVLDVPWTLVDAGGSACVLERDLGPDWPYAGTVRQHLELTEQGLAAELVLHAGEQMPATLGWHPWFPRRLATGGPVDLLAEPGRRYLRDGGGLPTGELGDPPAPPYDDCVTGLAAPPVVRWPGALELELSSRAATCWVLYDQLPEALCVEPQTGPPDALNLGRADVVPAGGRLGLDLQLRWRQLQAGR